MALQSSGQISLGNIYDEFHLNSDSKNNVAISGYLRNGGRVPNNNTNAKIPINITNGVKFSDYYGGNAIVHGFLKLTTEGASNTWTVPDRITQITVMLIGGAGAGGHGFAGNATAGMPGNSGNGGQGGNGGNDLPPGGQTGANRGGAGGGGGGAGALLAYVNVTPGQVFSYIVGKNGIPGTPYVNGISGTASVFGSLVAGAGSNGQGGDQTIAGAGGNGGTVTSNGTGTAIAGANGTRGQGQPGPGETAIGGAGGTGGLPSSVHNLLPAEADSNGPCVIIIW